jgi:hypothetical protein
MGYSSCDGPDPSVIENEGLNNATFKTFEH